MDYNEVLQRARERIGPKCKVCPECNGLGCGNTMPGPGSKAPGNGANDNWRAWRRWSLNMDTIAPNTPVDTSLALLGRTFSLPVIAAPIGSLRAQFNPGDDIRDYNACAAAAAAQSSRTLPVICVSTFESVFGVSCARSAHARSDRRRPYLFAISSACAQLELSGYAGPEAIMSSGSPRISLSTTAKTCAGAQCRAKRPPLTAESRLRIVLISTMSAPAARS